MEVKDEHSSDLRRTVPRLSRWEGGAMTAADTKHLHPDDVLFFHEVAGAMRRVAKDYELPLRSITPLSMPEKGMADRLGDCTSSGDIRLVLRATIDGVWCELPRTPAEVWRTAAHELSHLKHLNHGAAFWEYHHELMRAIENQQVDHREKVIARLVKMQASRDGEAKLGNSAAAEAFAEAINRMLLDHELSPSDLDYARAADNDPVIEIYVNRVVYKIEEKQTRVAWQESLARIVAKAHLCTFLVSPGSNNIIFVGTKSHVTVAEYVYGTLVPVAAALGLREYRTFRYECLKRDGHKRAANGFLEAWLSAFLARIEERFTEARQAAVTAAPEGTSVALVRLSGALRKVDQYIDNKFKRKRSASPLDRLRVRNAEGAARGRAAADRMTIGRRGVTSGSGAPPKLLGS